MRTLLGMEVKLDVPFDVALARTREALKTEGFGVLTEVDLQAAFREKLGRAFRPYVILGACNPALAHTAVSADPEVGLLLPCNVTVEADADGRVGGPGGGSGASSDRGRARRIPDRRRGGEGRRRAAPAGNRSAQRAGASLTERRLGPPASRDRRPSAPRCRRARINVRLGAAVSGSIRWWSGRVASGSRRSHRG
jgi:hypothetical protein